MYRFFSQRKCLFVFDNAEKYKSHAEYDNGIDNFLPADRKRLHVQITSQNQNCGKESLAAAKKNNLEKLEKLLEKSADANVADDDGITLLHYALNNDNLNMHVKPEKLYDFVNTKTTTSGATALQVAVKNGSLDFVRLLLKHNAIRNILNHKCETPLYVSTSESVDRLLYYIEVFFEDVKN
ncbi:BRCA1-associated RING domain protein 1-like [Nasonia vitripennis]|uniref:Uncharacterized protein n=1 Tax=Nasonia vitripennis TaxID=7425 RepID=A0A7M7LQL3_NASVI|nr:BRCA1-associated RING domain protein 1-like [Nasonia vitripennis]